MRLTSRLRFAALATTFLVMSGLVVSVTRGDAADAADLTVPYEVYVEPGVAPASHAAMFLSMIGIDDDEAASRIKHVYSALVPGYAVELTWDEAEAAERIALDDGDVVSFRRSWEVSASPIGTAPAPTDDLADQSALRRHGMPKGVDASGVVIAVLDTGADLDHPRLDVVPGLNAVEPGKPIVDVQGHGTFVTSVIESAAPGATVLIEKVLGDAGYGTSADVAAGLDDVGRRVRAGEHIDAVNMSLGGQNPVTPDPDTDLVYAMILALGNLDVPTIASAGNSATDAANFSPANYPEVFTVSAIADYDGEPGGNAPTPPVPWAVSSVDDALATFSNYGAGVDGTAVGVGNRGYSPTTWDLPGGPTRVAISSGTSFSGPLWAAAIGRYRADNPDQPYLIAFAQVSRYSTLYGGTFTGDPDGIAEPVLWLGEVPRWEG